MSNETGPPHGYVPAKPAKQTKLTLDEFAQFKKLFEDSPLAKWIVLAGVGALAELVHVLWLAARYIWRF